jgi:hypothetical protein
MRHRSNEYRRVEIIRMRSGSRRRMREVYGGTRAMARVEPHGTWIPVQNSRNQTDRTVADRRQLGSLPWRPSRLPMLQRRPSAKLAASLLLWGCSPFILGPDLAAQDDPKPAPAAAGQKANGKAPSPVTAYGHGATEALVHAYGEAPSWAMRAPGHVVPRRGLAPGAQPCWLRRPANASSRACRPSPQRATRALRGCCRSRPCGF